MSPKRFVLVVVSFVYHRCPELWRPSQIAHYVVAYLGYKLSRGDSGCSKWHPRILGYYELYVPPPGNTCVCHCDLRRGHLLCATAARMDIKVTGRAGFYRGCGASNKVVRRDVMCPRCARRTARRGGLTDARSSTTPSRLARRRTAWPSWPRTPA